MTDSTLVCRALWLRDTFLDLIFPRRCVGCGREGAYICMGCEEALPRVETPWCSRCGLPRSGPCECGTSRGRIWALDGLRAPFVFDGVVREAIHALKYGNLRAIALPLAQYLAGVLRDEPLGTGVIVPVPLHPKRIRERGYNQSELLARHLGKELGLPVATGCLKRTKHTVPQARSADVDQRRANVLGAFRAGPGQISGFSILLVDDVTTTGSTLEACATELKRAGAQAVWGLAVAREL